MMPTIIRSKPLAESRRKQSPSGQGRCVRVDLAAILSIDHACRGCSRPGTCCCASYEVCVDTAELKNIIRFLPEAAKLCPHLKTAKGYNNVFEEVEPGLYALDTSENGLCVFAFISGRTIRCSLHAVALNLGLPLQKIKPQACLLWPLSTSDENDVLSLDNKAFSFRCVSRRRNPSRRFSPALRESIELLYGNDFMAQLKKRAGQGRRHARILRPLREHHRKKSRGQRAMPG